MHDQGHSRFPGYAVGLVTEVLKKTNAPLALVEEDGFGYDSELRIAGPGRPIHEVAYISQYRQFGLHFLISGAYKILRMWDVPSIERFLPASRLGDGLPSEDLADLRRKLFRTCERHLEDEVSRFLYQGMVRQLTSMPVDIRVERKIARELPDHRCSQNAYLKRQVKDLEPHFGPECVFRPIVIAHSGRT